jgi:site-specific DNA-cytosine methylase
MTPTEHERCQGFPDGWTLPDGPSLAATDPFLSGGPANTQAPRKLNHQRWEAAGRAVTVPVIEWIGRGVLEAEATLREEATCAA